MPPMGGAIYDEGSFEFCGETTKNLCAKGEVHLSIAGTQFLFHFFWSSIALFDCYLSKKDRDDSGRGKTTQSFVCFLFLLNKNKTKSPETKTNSHTQTFVCVCNCKITFKILKWNLWRGWENLKGIIPLLRNYQLREKNCTFSEKEEKEKKTR